MTIRAKAIRASSSLLTLLALCGFSPDLPAPIDTDFIVTAAPAYAPLAALNARERFPRGAQLMLVHAGQSAPLVSGFAASADANVSFDGAKVLFAGKKSSGDPWQIWELTLSDKSLRQVTRADRDAIRPLYLPGEQFVYAQRTPSGFQLVTSWLENPGETHPISFAAASAVPSDVLADGRILFESVFPLGSGATPEIFLVYSDGSGEESYRCDHGLARWAGKQLVSGDVVFTHGDALARFTSPLAHEERLAAPRSEYAGAIAEMPTGDWLLSARAAGSAHYAITLWKPGAAALQTVLQQPGQNLLEPVLIASRIPPRRHPSALHPWDYANLLALDARISRDGALKGTPATVRLETRDRDGRPHMLGTAPIEADGSYFVKVPGDKPIRFAVLDARGTVLRQERGWFWARAGEQRICVGCHAGPERAAENRIPDVLVRTTTPVDLTGPKTPTATIASTGGRSR